MIHFLGSEVVEEVKVTKIWKNYGIDLFDISDKQHNQSARISQGLENSEAEKYLTSRSKPRYKLHTSSGKRSLKRKSQGNHQKVASFTKRMARRRKTIYKANLTKQVPLLRMR